MPSRNNLPLTHPQYPAATRVFRSLSQGYLLEIGLLGESICLIASKSIRYKENEEK